MSLVGEINLYYYDYYMIFVNLIKTIVNKAYLLYFLNSVLATALLCPSSGLSSASLGILVQLKNLANEKHLISFLISLFVVFPQLHPGHGSPVHLVRPIGQPQNPRPAVERRQREIIAQTGGPVRLDGAIHDALGHVGCDHFDHGYLWSGYL